MLGTISIAVWNVILTSSIDSLKIVVLKENGTQFITNSGHLIVFPFCRNEYFQHSKPTYLCLKNDKISLRRPSDILMLPFIFILVIRTLRPSFYKKNAIYYWDYLSKQIQKLFKTLWKNYFFIKYMMWMIEYHHIHGNAYEKNQAKTYSKH